MTIRNRTSSRRSTKKCPGLQLPMAGSEWPKETVLAIVSAMGNSICKAEDEHIMEISEEAVLKNEESDGPILEGTNNGNWTNVVPEIKEDRNMGQIAHDDICEQEDYAALLEIDKAIETLEKQNSEQIVTPEIEAEIKALYLAHPELNSTAMGHGGWIQTYTGKKFYPQNPTPESICIEDIAHALSMICRFGGHSQFFYSVAQHSVLVSYLCHEENKLCALLHDGSEFALNDVLSPIKKLPEMTGYRALEKTVQQAIYNKWGVFGETRDVKYADLLALSIEANTLLASVNTEWKLPHNITFLKIEPLSPKEAEKLFLERFSELTK